MAEQSNGEVKRDGSSGSAEPEQKSHSASEDDGKANRPSPPQPAKEQPKKPSKLKEIWQKIGLDYMTLKTMFKGSLPPIIALSMYQAPAVSGYFGNIGYLVAIASILGFAIMPRGKFIQSMTMNVVAICFAAALNLLALFCVTKAREHTTPAGTPPTVVAYNATASTAAAVWLCVQVYMISALKAARPQFQFPAILWTIFSVVSMTYAVMFPTMTVATSFMKTLITAFMAGFGLATAVHFVIFPLSSRTVVFKEMTGYLQLLNGCLKLQTAYMSSLETVDPVELKAKHDKQVEDEKLTKHKKKNVHIPTILETPPLVKLRETRDKLLDLHSKLSADITPAKRDFAWGKLESHDLTVAWGHMRRIFLPVLGCLSMVEMLEGLAKKLHWTEEEVTAEEKAERHHQLDNVHFLLKELHGPFASTTAILDEAFQHIMITLEFTKPPKSKKSDVESAEHGKPGTTSFAAVFKQKVDDYHATKEQTLKDWAHEHDIDLPPDFFESTFVCPQELLDKDEPVRERHQRQLFFILYLIYLLGRTCTSVLELVLWVDQRKQDGVLDKSKFIFPGSKTLYKWFWSVLGREDFTSETSYNADIGSGIANDLYLGEEFQRARDPEHLPPQDRLERFGDALRGIPKFFRSRPSMFALRVVAATMTIGIVAYIRQTQTFFLRQRLLWAMIMVTISMTTTAGQSIQTFGLRIFGTFVAMVGSYLIWYIVDGKTAGALVLLWVWVFGAFYFVVKTPKLVIVAILSLVTAILIIGYELQVRVIGVEAATQNGQPAYPTYELAPYRLATVAGGIAIAFIWTIFPYPVSESSDLRRDISASLYIMSAYYSVVHETIRMRVTGSGGDENMKGTHAHHLEKARTAMFVKLAALQQSLKTNAAFSKFQLQIGGKFPRQDYEQLIGCVSRLMLWTSLASYASHTFRESDDADPEAKTWTASFRELVSKTSITSNKNTMLLSLVSSSFGNGQPLPPYIELPKAFEFAQRLEKMNPDLISIRHFAEPEYSAFAVMQIASQNITEEILELVTLVKKLVGEIDFTFHSLTPSLTTSSTNSSDRSEDSKGKQA